VDFTFEFSEDAKHLTVTLVGVVDSEGVDGFSLALLADERFRSGLTWLVDLSCATEGVSPEEVRERAATRVLERDWRRPPRAIAFVAGNGAVARELELWRAQLGGSQSHRRVFRSREEAEAWLVTQADA
jgi:hypothetical protein